MTKGVWPITPEWPPTGARGAARLEKLKKFREQRLKRLEEKVAKKSPVLMIGAMVDETIAEGIFNLIKRHRLEHGVTLTRADILRIALRRLIRSGNLTKDASK